MNSGLPVKVPAAVVDMDNSRLSRQMILNLENEQMVRFVARYNDFGDAREAMQRGEIFGCYVIPKGFQSELFSVRKPMILYYTDMAYYVPASLLYKSFKTTALYVKADVISELMRDVGVDDVFIASGIQPFNVKIIGLGNPTMDYAVYLCNSFVPAIIQLMIFLTTTFSVSHEIKRGTSQLWLRLSGQSIGKALLAKLFPQTILWWLMVLLMIRSFYVWNGFPMNGSSVWLVVSELMYVLACQGFALFIVAILPNLRLSLSVVALIGVISFSVAAFSFPYEDLYGAVGIFSWILPVRYNFLIYVNLVLNGSDVYYSRFYYAAYILFMLLPMPFLPRLKRELSNPVYVP